MNKAPARHLAAILAGHVTKSNVIGIRKAMNTEARQSLGYRDGCTAPKVTAGEIRAISLSLAEIEPVVSGDLALSGRAILENRRWRKRWTPAQQAIIDAGISHFRLVRFDMLDRYAVPVYRAISGAGSFLFRNVPWQQAAYCGSVESGPVAVGECSPC